MPSEQESVLPYEVPFLDAIRLFEEVQIRYALIGGVAAMFYGRGRFTDDVDFIAASGHMQVLEQNPDAMRKHHFDPNCVSKLYHESGIEIDIWKDQFLDEMISRARRTTYAGKDVNVVEPNDLIAMKLRADRYQDYYDISELIRNGHFDVESVRARVTSEQFAKFEEILRKVTA